MPNVDVSVTLIPRWKAMVMILAGIALALILLANVQAATAESPAAPPSDFRAILTGAKEVPGPGDPDGVGVARVRLNPDTDMVCYLIRVRNILLPASASHIHRGTADVSGPVVITFDAPDESGRSSGCVAADSALIDEIIANPDGFYVNVHNSEFGPGAVRGQLTSQ